MNEKILVGSPISVERKTGKIQKGQLVYLITDLPFDCKNKCQKCYRRPNVSMKDFDLELRKQKIAEAAAMGAQVVGIPGEGEPLLHWGIVKELVQLNHSLDLITILYTSGSLLNQEKVEFLFVHGVTLIISCDSFSPVTYGELTGGGDFSRVKTGLKIAREIYIQGIEKQDETILTRLGMITIVCKQNKHEIFSLKDWCGDDVFFICNYPIQKGNAVKNWPVLVGDELEILKELSRQFTDTGHAGVSTPLVNGRCGAAYHGLTIDAKGEVLVCPASVDVSVGNIRNESLQALRQKTMEYIIEMGSPFCLAREGVVLKNHDGVIVG